MALPSLLQPVVVEHLQDPLALEAGVHSPSQLQQLLAALGPAMVPVPYTLLQESLILDAGPHALRHIPQHYLKTTA